MHQHPQVHVQQNGGGHPPYPHPAPPTSPQTSRTTTVGYSLRTRGPSKEEALPNGNHPVYPGELHPQSRGPPHPYPNGSALDDDDEMDVDEHPQARSKRAAAVATNGKFGSTGRTNFVSAPPFLFYVPRIEPANSCLRSEPIQTARTSPPFLPQARPRAYSSDLEENTNVWKDALGRYALKTRVRAKEVETVWRDYEDVSRASLLGYE